MVAKTTIFRNYDARKMSENYAVSAGIARERTSTNQMCSSFSLGKTWWGPPKEN